MPSNLGTTITFNGNNGLLPLYPSTPMSQILGNKFGQLFGPYQLTLSATGWSNNQQTVALEGVTSDDILYCVKVLSGTADEMKAQDEAYSMLDPRVGIESLDGQVRFTCTSESPTIALTVQVHWFR